MIVINLVNLRIVIALFQTEGDWVQETVRVFTGISAAALVKIFHASRAALIRNGNQPLRFTVISPPNNLATSNTNRSADLNRRFVRWRYNLVAR